MGRLTLTLLAVLSLALSIARPAEAAHSALEPSFVRSHALPLWGGGTSLRKVGLLTALGLIGLGAIVAKYEMEGPVEAEVLRVVDGDTLTVRAKIWIGQELTTNVRLSGVNAPELSGTCDAERALAEQARRFLTERVEGRAVTLRNIARWSRWWRTGPATSRRPCSPLGWPCPMMAAAAAPGASEDEGGQPELGRMAGGSRPRLRRHQRGGPPSPGAGLGRGPGAWAEARPCLAPVHPVGHQVLHHRRIGQGRGVAEV
jgi:endonuclease YncB( thermonuclease family)